MPRQHAYSTGPKTEAGKAVAARNATTHGLFCRQTVLPHLGEDPQAYQRLLDTLIEQLRPRNLMERQYLELWADASWKLRRFSRLEAQAWEDPRLTDDTRLAKLERLARLQNSLRRQMDKAVKMLLGEVHDLYEGRIREDVMAKREWTESSCHNRMTAEFVEREVQANRHWPMDEDILREGVDTPPPPPDPQPEKKAPRSGKTSKKVQNELPEEGFSEEGLPQTRQEICQNELPAQDTDEAEDTDEESRNASESWSEADWDAAYPLSDKEQREREIQSLEDRVNDGTMTPREKVDLLTSSNIPGWYSAGDKRIVIHRK
jgi:hypothetical protein